MKMVTYSMSKFFNFGLESPDFKFHLYCFVRAHNGIYKVLWGKFINLINTEKIYMKIVICNIKITRLWEFFWSKTITVGSTYVIQCYKVVKCLNETCMLQFKQTVDSFNSTYASNISSLMLTLYIHCCHSRCAPYIRSFIQATLMSLHDNRVSVWYVKEYLMLFTS